MNVGNVAMMCLKSLFNLSLCLSTEFYIETHSICTGSTMVEVQFLYICDFADSVLKYIVRIYSRVTYSSNVTNKYP